MLCTPLLPNLFVQLKSRWLFRLASKRTQCGFFLLARENETGSPGKRRKRLDGALGREHNPDRVDDAADPCKNPEENVLC